MIPHNPSGGGAKINGIIEQYTALAGEKLSAGDFVDYVMSSKLGTESQVSTVAGTGSAISAVLLPSGKVFVAHSHGTTTSTLYLYGVVLTITGTTITKGTDTQLSTVANSANTIRTLLLPTGDVFVTHSLKGYPYSDLYCMAVSVSGAVVSPGTEVRVTSICNYVMSMSLLKDGKVFIGFNGSEDGYLYGIVVAITNRVVTYGTYTLLREYKYSANSLAVCTMVDGRVLIVHSYGSATSGTLYGMIVTVAGMTITVNTDNALSNLTMHYTWGWIELMLLDNGDIFIAHRPEGSNHIAIAIIRVANLVITTGAQVFVNPNVSGSIMHIGTTKLIGGNILMSFGSDTSDLYVTQILIDDLVVMPSAIISVSTVASAGYVSDLVVMPNGYVVAPHNRHATSWFLNALVIPFGLRKSTTLTSNLLGVVKSINADSTVNVFIPG